MAWIKPSKKDMAVTFSYSPLEYYLIKLVGPRKKAQISQNYLRKCMKPTKNIPISLEKPITLQVPLKKSAMYRE